MLIYWLFPIFRFGRKVRSGDIIRRRPMVASCHMETNSPVLPKISQLGSLYEAIAPLLGEHRNIFLAFRRSEVPSTDFHVWIRGFEQVSKSLVGFLTEWWERHEDYFLVLMMPAAGSAEMHAGTDGCFQQLLDEFLRTVPWRSLQRGERPVLIANPSPWSDVIRQRVNLRLGVTVRLGELGIHLGPEAQDELARLTQDVVCGRDDLPLTILERFDGSLEFSLLDADGQPQTMVVESGDWYHRAPSIGLERRAPPGQRVN